MQLRHGQSDTPWEDENPMFHSWCLMELVDDIDELWPRSSLRWQNRLWNLFNSIKMILERCGIRAPGIEAERALDASA